MRIFSPNYNRTQNNVKMQIESIIHSLNRFTKILMELKRLYFLKKKKNSIDFEVNYGLESFGEINPF